MPIITPIDDCRNKAINVQTAVKSVIFDEFQNTFLLENYIECLKEALETAETLISIIKSEENTTF